MEAYPNGILSIVSDTFDLWTVINEYLPALKDDILARDGKLVVRPDTGNPADIVCGTKSNPNTVSTQQLRTMKGDPEYFGVLELLWKHFGGTINKKGYKELDSHIGVIYGDGMNYDTINEILTRMEKAKFASSNVVFGMGSYNFQGNITRDTFNSAVKATFAEVNGQPVNIFKNPITGDGMKKSATGLLSVVKDNGSYKLIEKATPKELEVSELKTIWKNGAFKVKYSFEDIRNNLHNN